MEENRRMKKPKARLWTDPKTGKQYLRVRSTDANGKSVARMFTEQEDADEYIATLVKERKRHGAAAVNSDEIDALRVWREYVSKEHTAGRDAPALRDVIRGTIERLSVGTSTAALSDLHKKFRDSREKAELSASHVSGLKYRLKRFVSYFPKDEAAGNINTEAIERALSSMRAGGLTAQTVKGIRGAAHAMFEWGVDRGLVGSNPVSRSKAPKVTQGEVGTITASQLKGLLRTALKTNPQMVPALATWAFTGVRRAELCRLRYDDFDHARKELRVSAAAAKTGTARFIPIPPCLKEWLDAAKAAGVLPVGKIIPGDTDMLAEAWLNREFLSVKADAGLTEWPQNAMRHSFASHASAKFEDFGKVGAWIGHAQDAGLLIQRYRHAVRKSEGEAWFEVLPKDKPAKKAAKKAAQKTPAKRKAV